MTAPRHRTNKFTARLDTVAKRDLEIIAARFGCDLNTALNAAVKFAEIFTGTYEKSDCAFERSQFVRLVKQ